MTGASCYAAILEGHASVPVEHQNEADTKDTRAVANATKPTLNRHAAVDRTTLKRPPKR